MVSVSSIGLKAFGLYDDVSLDLPETGVVLVTGPNGAGKTSFMQGVAHGLWGKSVIGDEMWKPGEKSEVKVNTSDLEVVRSRSKGGTKSLKWGGIKHATTSKAQKDLESEIGPMDLWRWSAVFVNDAPDLFTRATDRARKHLLETAIPNLDKFDPALKAVRADVRATTDAVRLAEVDLFRLRGVIEASRSALEASKPRNPTDEHLRELEDAETLLHAELATIDSMASEVSEREASIKVERTSDDAAAEDLRRRINLLSAGKCPTCGFATSSLDLVHMREKVEDADRSRSRRVEAAEVARREVAPMLARVNERRSVKYAEVRAIQQDRMCAQRDRQTFERWEQSTAGARERIAQAEQDATQREQDLEKHQETLVYQGACEKVLGLKGARARVTGQALAAIDAAANRRLAQLAGDGWGIRLRAYSEQKSGKVEEKISLQVRAPDHPGVYRGYWSTSSGQRRRFDIATMLAISDVVRGLSGGGLPTLFFDEAFGGFDEDGKRRAVKLIDDLAQETCVVVVEHDADLINRLRPTKHVQVAGGSIQ